METPEAQIDETTCNTWSGNRHTWMNKEAPVTVVLPKRRQSTSVFGGITPASEACNPLRRAFQASRGL